MYAAIFRNQVNRKPDLFREGGARYHRSPPNMNGAFSVLHHNFYPLTYLGDDENAFDIEEQYDVLPEGEPHPWLSMSDSDIVTLIDEGFLDCFTTEQRVSLWNHFLPLILRYQMTFCSLCCCRLPEFYFTKSQRRCKRTERACAHCDRNRQIKIGQVTQILGAAGYFVQPRDGSVDLLAELACTVLLSFIKVEGPCWGKQIVHGPLDFCFSKPCGNAGVKARTEKTELGFPLTRHFLDRLDGFHDAAVADFLIRGDR
eukprot:scaffold203980_cov40-Attheya_sp.AAC.2